MADISKIEEFWDDNPIDVSAEVILYGLLQIN